MSDLLPAPLQVRAADVAFARLVPSWVAVAEGAPDPGAGMLFAEEEQFIARAVPRRRAEFIAVRECAARALAVLGRPRAAMVPGRDGAPPWPAGVVGSLTHGAGLCAAAAAPADRGTGLGIDAEADLPLPAGVVRSVTSVAERRRLAVLSQDRPEIAWDRLLFSAKESVFKAWYPAARRWLGFEDAEVDLRHDGTFGVRLLVPPPGAWRGCAPLCGRWSTDGRFVRTALVLGPGRVGTGVGASDDRSAR